MLRSRVLSLPAPVNVANADAPGWSVVTDPMERPDRYEPLTWYLASDCVRNDSRSALATSALMTLPAMSIPLPAVYVPPDVAGTDDPDDLLPDDSVSSGWPTSYVMSRMPPLTFAMRLVTFAVRLRPEFLSDTTTPSPSMSESASFGRVTSTLPPD